MYKISGNYVISMPLEALQCVLHIILRPIYVVIANETIVILKFWLLQEGISPILLHVHIAYGYVQLVLIKLLQFFWNLLVFVQPKIEVVALRNQSFNALKHPLLSIWKRSH